MCQTFGIDVTQGLAFETGRPLGFHLLTNGFSILHFLIFPFLLQERIVLEGTINNQITTTFRPLHLAILIILSLACMMD